MYKVLSDIMIFMLTWHHGGLRLLEFLSKGLLIMEGKLS